MENYLEVIRTVAVVLVGVTLIIHMLNLGWNVNKQRADERISQDKELLEQSTQSLKWAFDALTDQGQSIPPIADRLNWLTAARQICRYWEISKNIKSNVYQIILAEHEEYWRHKFYLAIDQKTLKNKKYFMDLNDDYWPENITPDSAQIINHFATWGEQIKDPIKQCDMTKLITTHGGTLGNGLGEYCEVFDCIREQWAKEGELSNKDKVIDPVEYY